MGLMSKRSLAINDGVKDRRRGTVLLIHHDLPRDSCTANSCRFQLAPLKGKRAGCAHRKICIRIDRSQTHHEDGVRCRNDSRGKAGKRNGLFVGRSRACSTSTGGRRYRGKIIRESAGTIRIIRAACYPVAPLRLFYKKSKRS